MGQLDMEGIEAGRFDPSAKKCYDDDLMALTATMVGLAGSLAAPKEIPIQKEGLRKVLEELEKGNDVPISDVVSFIRELDGQELASDDEVEVEQKIEDDIKHVLKLGPKEEYLSMNQTMEFLSGELQVDTEEDIMKAFTVFDKDNQGVITLEEFNSIMEERGNPLNEEELKMISKCTIMFEVAEQEEPAHEGDENDSEQTTFINDNNNDSNNKGNRLRSKTKKKTKKNAKESKDVKLATNEPVVKGPKDIKVNYREFVKYLMEKINTQEKTLWGEK